ncbi:MAG: hypothetical protein ACREQY_15365, partial [Candidatus Binatia bacterium]
MTAGDIPAPRGSSGDEAAARMIRPPPRIVFVTHRFQHHATRSGYDRILESVPGERLEPDRLIRLTRWLPERIFSWVRRASGMELYG